MQADHACLLHTIAWNLLVLKLKLKLNLLDTAIRAGSLTSFKLKGDIGVGW